MYGSELRMYIIVEKFFRNHLRHVSRSYGAYLFSKSPNWVIGFCNFSLFTHIFCRFTGIFIEKTTFEELEEICEQIHKEKGIQWNNGKEIIDSNIDLLRKFQLKNMFQNI